MPRRSIAILLVAVLVAGAGLRHAASAQSLFEGLSAGAKQIADSGDLRLTSQPAILAGLTQTAELVADSATQSTGPVRTICVRMCDGYYWPLSSAAARSQIETDAQACQSACRSDTRLFTLPAGSDDVAAMTDLYGRVYGRFPNAFAYRRGLKPGCGCHPMPWSEESRARHDAYAAAMDHKSAISTPLGAALDAIASRAAPSAKAAPMPAALAAAASDTIVATTQSEMIVTADTLPGGPPAVQAETQPADTLAAQAAGPETAPEVAAGSVPSLAAGQPSVAAIDAQPEASATAALPFVPQSAAALVASQANGAGETPSAAPVAAPDAIATAPEDQPSIAQAAAELTQAAPAEADGSPVSATTAAPETIHTAAAETLGAPALPAEIERIMGDSELPPPASGVAAEPAAHEVAEPMVVASIGAEAAKMLEDSTGESITARSVNPNPVRSRPRAPRPTSSPASVSAPASASTSASANAASIGATMSDAEPTATDKGKTQSTPFLFAPFERRATEVRRPPRGLFQFE